MYSSRSPCAFCSTEIMEWTWMEFEESIQFFTILTCLGMWKIIDRYEFDDDFYVVRYYPAHKIDTLVKITKMPKLQK